jgi:hypothetical protein
MWSAVASAARQRFGSETVFVRQQTMRRLFTQKIQSGGKHSATPLWIGNRFRSLTNSETFIYTEDPKRWQTQRDTALDRIPFSFANKQ